MSSERISAKTKNGGLGFKKIDCQNDAFLMKIDYNLIRKPEQLWVQVIGSKYKWKGKAPIVVQVGNASQLWKCICRIWSKVWENVGKGLDSDFWRDTWVKEWGPLINVCTQPEIIPIEHVSVMEMVLPSGDWKWELIKDMLPPPVVSCIASYKPLFVSNVDDFVGWDKDSCHNFTIYFTVISKKYEFND